MTWVFVVEGHNALETQSITSREVVNYLEHVAQEDPAP